MNGKHMATTATAQCVYCLGHFPREQMTDDHVIAGSWYPETTPGHVQRPTAPACKDCNNRRYAPIERYVMVRLAACVDPQHPAAAGIWEKARQSIDPERARRERDRMHRAMQRAALGREVRELTGIPKATLPFSIPNLGKGSRHGIMISATKLNTLVEKWARGFYYCVHGQPLSASGRIQVIHVGDEHAAVAFREIWQHARAIDGGPGVHRRRGPTSRGNIWVLDLGAVQSLRGRERTPLITGVERAGAISAAMSG